PNSAHGRSLIEPASAWPFGCRYRSRPAVTQRSGPTAHRSRCQVSSTWAGHSQRRPSGSSTFHGAPEQELTGPYSFPSPPEIGTLPCKAFHPSLTELRQSSISEDPTATTSTSVSALSVCRVPTPAAHTAFWKSV